MRYFKDVADTELANKRVLLRADLNVPIQGNAVVDTFRIRCSTQSILHLKDKGAKTIIIAHIGREPKESLEYVAAELRKYVPLSFVKDVIGTDARAAISAMRAGDVLLLENIRQLAGETENEPALVQQLAGLGDFYVNDAFSAAHRAHASIVGLAQILPHCGGFLLQEEVENLSLALMPQSPSLAILGGAKFETKEPLIKKLLAAYDHVFLAGALVNDALKAKGHEVGRSLISDGVPDTHVLENPKLIFPVDVLVEASNGQARVRPVREVARDEKIVDIGPESFGLLLPYIRSARTILWNGPTGWYEGGYDDWTHALAQAIAESGSQSIVGGGDTVAAIGKSGLDQQFTFLSTAGGAMLEFLLNGTLPGLQALE